MVAWRFLKLTTNTFEFFDKSRNFPEHALFLGQVLRIERAHLGQNGIQFGACLAGKFPFQRIGDVAFGRLGIQALVADQLLGLALLFCLGKGEEGINHAGLVADLVQIGLIDKVDQQAYPGR